MLLSIALASGGMLVWPMVASGMNAGALSATGAVTLINREKAVVIDVSETEEFAAVLYDRMGQPMFAYPLPAFTFPEQYAPGPAGEAGD